MATGGGGNSTFYDTSPFDDNFTPPVPEHKRPDTVPSEHGQSSSSNNAAVDSHMSTLGLTTATTKNNSRPSSPVQLGQPSPLVCYALRLKHGEELRKSLLNFCAKHELKAAFVLTCVGSAVSAKLRLASALPNVEGNYMLDMTQGTEIVSLQGTISNGGHLHASLADVTGKVIGGHLLELIVDTTVEVVIGECTSLSFTRVPDQDTGFKELVVDPR